MQAEGDPVDDAPVYEVGSDPGEDASDEDTHGVAGDHDGERLCAFIGRREISYEGKHKLRCHCGESGDEGEDLEDGERIRDA